MKTFILQQKLSKHLKKAADTFYNDTIIVNCRKAKMSFFYKLVLYLFQKKHHKGKITGTLPEFCNNI